MPTPQWYKAPPPPLDEDQLRETGEIYGPRVVEFCEQHEGDLVGNGECWTLAAEALKAAGARPAHSYNFGQKIDASQVGLGGWVDLRLKRERTGSSAASRQFVRQHVSSGSAGRYSSVSRVCLPLDTTDGKKVAVCSVEGNSNPDW